MFITMFVSMLIMVMINDVSFIMMRTKQAIAWLDMYLFASGAFPSTENLKYPTETFKNEEPKVIA